MNPVVVRLAVLASLLVVAAGCSGGGQNAAPSGGGSPPPSGSAGRPVATGCDWPRFGFDAGRSNSGPAQTGVSAQNVGHPTMRRTLRLPGTVDSSPIYLHNARVAGRIRDVFV